MLQDTPFTEAEFASFQLSPSRKVGGVTTLIPSKLRQHRLPDTAGNLLTCCIEGIVCINSYAAPSRQQSHAQAFLETLVAHKLEHVPWFTAGDHNENPQDSHFQASGATHGGVVLGIPEDPLGGKANRK